MKALPALILILSCYTSAAQPKYNNNWYFGDNAAMSFSSDPPATPADNSMKTYRCAASVSDEKTGALLFYTNGFTFWNRFGELIDSTQVGPSASDVIIIPLKAHRNRFAVFNFANMYVVDMTARNGRGAIISNKPFPLRSSYNRMTAVKHCLSESYWLITIEGISFCAYLVHPDGTIDDPVVTPHHTLEVTTGYFGDFVSSNDGNKLALTNYTSYTSGNWAAPQVFDFDKRCGTVSSSRVVLPMEANWDHPHGIAFSPDDKLIYVSYGYQESQLVQYAAADPSIRTVIAVSPQNFNQMACGPDGRLYITTHISGIPSNKIDVVHFPNRQGAACSYQEDYLRLKGVTNFEVPNMIVNHSSGCVETPEAPVLSVSEGACTGDRVDMKYKGDHGAVDSIKWFYRDTTSSLLLYSKFYNTFYNYLKPGVYKPQAVIYFCGKADTLWFETDITDRPVFSLGKDTTICSGDSLILGPFGLSHTYRWSTGDTTKQISLKKAGTYSLFIDHKGCTGKDDIELSIHPDLWTMLGDRYFICEAEQELVLLNAGKGFKSYLWTPTGDTTQWIEVTKKGNYYVIVKDYTGCKTEDNTIVEERCDFTVYIPNAFSPNDDGLNDEFRVVANNAVTMDVSIFNRWGEKIYSGNGSQAWNGMNGRQKVPQDVYLCVVKVSGFLNKKPVTRRYSATVHVVY